MSGRIERGKYYSQHEIDHRGLINYVDNSIDNLTTYVDDEIAAIVVSGSGEFDVVDDYDALRAYVGSASGLVVKDFTYTFNSISYTTIGGVFVRSTTGTENGGTLLIADNAVKWKRLWDATHVIPEWWEVGGVDSSGASYSTFNAGNGIANDNERINAAIITVGQGGVIELQKDKTYDIWTTLPLRIGQTINGNNATLRRGDLIVSDLAVNASSGTSITVDDASIFREGMSIGIIDISAANSGVAFDENDGNVMGNITDITGNVITFANAISDSFVIGDKVFVRNQIVSSSTSSDLELIKIEGVKFDGNKSSNNLTVDWRYNATISIGYTNLYINNCYFFDTPSENIFAAKCRLTNSYYQDLNGSLIHISDDIDNRPGEIVIEGCWGDGSNYNPVLMGHSESVITFSANVFNVTINNCNFKNGEGAVFGGLSADNSDFIRINNSHFENYFSIFEGSSSTTDDLLGNIILTGNRFYNCGELNFIGRNTARGFSLNKIMISNNEFINVRVMLRQCSQIKITDNHFWYDDVNWTIKADYDDNPPNYNQPGWMTIFGYDSVHIENNVIEGPVVFNEFIQYGILLIHSNAVRKTSLGVDTEYFYGQDIKVNNNTLRNFKYGIWAGSNIPVGFATRGVSAVNQHVGVEVKNNLIFSCRDAAMGADQVAIYAECGVVVDGNTVYFEIAGYGIVGLGVDDVSTHHQRLQGAIVKNNIIYNGSIHLGGNSNNEHNITCINNLYTGSISASATTLSDALLVNNNPISVATFTSMIDQQMPIYKDWAEDANQY